MQLTKKQKEYWKKVKESVCKCGAYQSQHRGFQGHGDNLETYCKKFTWTHYIDAKGQKI